MTENPITRRNALTDPNDAPAPLGTWKSIQARFRELVAVRDAAAPMEPAWRGLQEAVKASTRSPPYHLLAPLRLAQDAARRKGNMSIQILDYGCGGGSTLLYLLASGFEGIHGVDVGGNCIRWNRWLRDQFGMTDDRFMLYDGKKLPFADGSFDLVISEEVVEHIPDELIEAYYREGARVLRPDGVAYFTAPHRLGPYDSHTRSWGIHYLPRPIAVRTHALRNEAHRQFFENHLFLRWPRFHQTMLDKFYGTTRNLNRERLNALIEFDYYDGPKRLRQWVGRLGRIPVIGPLAQHIIAKILMAQTISKKTKGELPAIY